MAGWLRVSATMLLRCRACYAVLAAVLAMAEAQQPSQQQRASVPTLLPSVRSLQRLSGDDIDVAALSVAAAVGSQPHVVAQAKRVAAELGATAQAAGLRIELRQEVTLETQQLRDAHGAIGGEESYEITLTESGMTIAAPAPAGLFYGTRTALQLLRKAQHQRLPPLQIFDAPVSAYRGVMIDNVRSPHDAAFHMDFIQKLGDHKMNVYQLHSSDDQGYSMPSKAYPHLPNPRLALSQAEAEALQAKAVELHVQIVAEVDLPGHSNGLLKALPQLAAISNKTGKACSQINITSPEALSIMQTLLGEVMDLFPGVKWHHLGADEVSWSPECNMTKANYHRFINTMNTFVRSRNRTMVVWEGFDPAPEDDAPPIDKTVVVSPFDSVHLTPWPHRPHHYYDAGYNIINTDWNPLYLVSGQDPGFAAGPEVLSAWDPTKYGNYPNLGNSAANWQSLPSDNWNTPTYRSRFTSENASCWPDRSAHPPGYVPQPYPADRLLGGAICSWSNAQDVEDLMFFGGCFGNRSKYPSSGGSHRDCSKLPRPAPRAPIVAERLWAGAAQKPSTVLEAVDCAYYEVPPPPPPPSPPTPGGAFSPMKGACRDAAGRDPAARLDHKGPVKFADCHAKCAALGERCDALDVDGAEGCGPTGVCSWCAIWGNLTAADTDGLFLYYSGPGGRACKGVPGQGGGGNTCYRRPPFCTEHHEEL